MHLKTSILCLSAACAALACAGSDSSSNDNTMTTTSGGQTAGGGTATGGGTGNTNGGAAATAGGGTATSGGESNAGATGGGASAGGPSYAATVEPIFLQSCITGCHSGSSSLGGVDGANPMDSSLDLTMGQGYAGMVGVASLQVPTMSIVGDSAENSYLWYKLNNTQMSVGGRLAQMPWLLPALTDDQLNTIKAWIDGGAAP